MQPVRMVEAGMAETLKLEDAINEVCPWSGKPISADSLMRYKGQVVGFCNPGCRDKFEKAASMFDALVVDDHATAG